MPYLYRAITMYAIPIQGHNYICHNYIGPQRHLLVGSLEAHAHIGASGGSGVAAMEIEKWKKKRRHGHRCQSTTKAITAYAMTV